MRDYLARMPRTDLRQLPRPLGLSKHLVHICQKPHTNGLGLCLKMKKRGHKRSWNSVLKEKDGAYQENKSRTQDLSRNTFCSLKDARFRLGKRAWILVFEICMESWVQDEAIATEFAPVGSTLREICKFWCKVSKKDLQWRRGFFLWVFKGSAG